MGKIKVNEAKTRSSYQKDVNRLRKTCITLQKAIYKRNVFITQTNEFVQAMLNAGKVTKEDLKPYFRKNEKKN